MLHGVVPAQHVPAKAGSGDPVTTVRAMLHRRANISHRSRRKLAPSSPTSASGILGRRFRGDDPCPTLRPDMTAPRDFLVRPDPHDPRLTEAVTGVDQTGQPIATRVTVERPLTIFLNSQEIVTAMTINDYPEYLALGYLLNQHMLLPDDVLSGVDY